MADFDRSAEFRRSLKQMRDLRAQGYAFESAPLGGDALARGDTMEAQRAAADLARFDRLMARSALAQRKLEQKVARLEASVNGIRNGARESLAGQLRAEGFGRRSVGLKDVSPIKISGRGGIGINGRFLGGKLLTTTAALHTTAASLNSLFDARDEYRAVKDAGGTELAARERLKSRFFEAFGERVGALTGATSLFESVLRGSGMREDAARHAVERAVSYVFNRSELHKRELAQANAELAAHAELDHKFDKLTTQSPRTFRLRNAKDAEIFKRDRQRAMELTRQEEHSFLRMKQRQGRVAGGN